MTDKLCTVDGCDDKVSGRGFCNKHYQRWVNNGDPLVTKKRAKQAEICEKTDCDQPGYGRGLCLPHYRELQRSERGSCSVEDCDTPWFAKKLCAMHYSRYCRTGSTDEPLLVRRACSVENCEEPVRAKELCGKHYRNFRRYGTPEISKPEKVWLPCIHDNCPEMATRKKMCNRHYRQSLSSDRTICLEENCPNLARQRNGYCNIHGDGLAYNLRKLYNISVERYNSMLEKQDGRCAICRKTPEEAGITRLVVDHDHDCCPATPACGKCVRGLLCHCNRMIGMANDDPKILFAAIRYLQSQSSSSN